MRNLRLQGELSVWNPHWYHALCTARPNSDAVQPWVQPKHFCLEHFAFTSDRGAASPSTGVTLQCVKRKGWEHRCFCLSSSNTGSSSPSVCVAFSSLSCAGALLRLPKHLSVICHLTDLSTCALFPLVVPAGFAPPGFSRPSFVTTKIGQLFPLLRMDWKEELLLLQYFHIPDFSISSLMGKPVHSRTDMSSV